MLYKKYILRIFIMLMCWSFIYAIVLAFRKDVTLFSFVKAVLQGGDGYHLWYLYLCIGLYLLIPILRSFTNDIQISIYFCLLWVVFGVINIILKIGSTNLNILIGPFEKIEHNIFIGFTGYFLLGYLLSIIKLTKLQQFIIYVLGFLSIAVSYCSGLYMSIKTNTFGTITFTSFSYVLHPVSLITTSALFLFARYNMDNYFSERIYKLTRHLSDYTFGIYLVHVLVLYILKDLCGITIDTFQPLFSIPIITFFVFLISIIIVYTLKRIPVFKYLC